MRDLRLEEHAQWFLLCLLPQFVHLVALKEAPEVPPLFDCLLSISQTQSAHSDMKSSLNKGLIKGKGLKTAHTEGWGQSGV